MWPQSGQPLSVVPKEPTRLPPLADGNASEEASRRAPKARKGIGDLAAASRKRRDVALASPEKVKTLPGTLLKAKPLRGAVPELRSQEAHRGEQVTATEAETAVDPAAGGEVQALQEELKLRSAEVEQYRGFLKKRTEEYEGCMALVDVVQAELHLYKSRVHGHSPTPPRMKKWRMRWAGMCHNERERAEEVAAYFVDFLLARVAKALEADQAPQEAEGRDEEDVLALRGGVRAPGGTKSSRPPAAGDRGAGQVAHSMDREVVPRPVRPASRSPTEDMGQHHMEARRLLHEAEGTEENSDSILLVGAPGGTKSSRPPAAGDRGGQVAHPMDREVVPRPVRPASRSPTEETGHEQLYTTQASDGVVRMWDEHGLASHGAAVGGGFEMEEVEARTTLATIVEEPQSLEAETVAPASKGRDYGAPFEEDVWSFPDLGAGEEDDLDEEARRIAQKVQPQPACSYASSPPPDTGGTPKPFTEDSDFRTAATQTSVTGEVQEPAKPEKALVTAEEQIRVLKLVVANSKKEIAYYNQVLKENYEEHQQEVKELQESVEQERKRCTEDMMHWKKHVKKEFGRDPVLLVALHMWEREVTGLRTSNAFREWKRKMNQIKKARGAAGKIALLVAVHWVIRDWRLAVMELQAERLQAKLHTRWFNSLEKASMAWGRDMAFGLKSSVFTAWSWQKSFASWQRRSDDKFQFSLRRWFFAIDTALQYYTFLGWYEALMEVKLQGFRLQVSEKKSAYLKAIIAFAPSMTFLTERAIFYAWLWNVKSAEATAFSNALRGGPRRSLQLDSALVLLASESRAVVQLFVFRHWQAILESGKAAELSEKLKKTGASLQILKALTHFVRDGSPQILLQSVIMAWRRRCERHLEEPQALIQSSRFTLAFCISAYDFTSTRVAFMAWRDSSRRSYFQRHWMRFFRPEEDLHPLVQAWKTQVRRRRETSRNAVKVEKKEHDISWFAMVLCFVYWRMKLSPARAVVSFVPKLAHCKEVAVRKLGESQAQSAQILFFYAWRMTLHLMEPEEKDGATEGTEASARGQVGQVSAKKAAVAAKKDLEDAQAKVAALEKSLQEANEKVDKLEQEAKKKSCCCVVQ